MVRRQQLKEELIQELLEFAESMESSFDIIEQDIAMNGFHEGADFQITPECWNAMMAHYGGDRQRAVTELAISAFLWKYGIEQ